MSENPRVLRRSHPRGDDHPPGGDVHQSHPLQFPEDEAGVALAEALVAAGRKLLTVVYAVLRDDRMYVAVLDELIRSMEEEDGQREDLTFEDVSERG